MTIPTFNHTRADGPFDPCPICLEQMSRADLIALVKDLRADEPDLGRAGRTINRRAYVGAQIVQLKAQLAELEKLARKTPAKTLTAEVAKVVNAKSTILRVRQELADYEVEYSTGRPRRMR